ncbi:hypothetical protein [Aliarcobacter cryaerophilus]|uniref:hypothetical protein n=1 Tax=Aliarcobacter cryaerophilus TaxID=28198 RepID=UPI0021B5C763|nr:hypothetical protein [Aliarcobacter cryaerophilus]MCT7482122.1 hypothetical protein [Aliarcobacter cryaerophilus]
MKKHRMNSWSKSFAEVWRIYKNAYNSDKFVGTFLIGILFFSSLGIWLDLASQIITEQSNQNNTNMPFKIDSFFTFIVTFISLLIIDSFLEKEDTRDELKGIGILFIGIVIAITIVTYLFKSLWIILAYVICLLIYIAIEADKDKYDSEDDDNPIKSGKFDQLEDEE